MDNYKLKPCPFCHGEAYVSSFDTDIANECAVSIGCCECQAHTRVFYTDKKDVDMAIAEAAIAWNVREG